MRVLVGGIGYRHLRDGSIGTWVSDALAERVEPGNAIEVEDVSYHPVGLTQNLQERPDYERVVFVGSMPRGREPGTVDSYRWDGALPSRDEIQVRVSEAVTGVISLENTLIVCKALGGLPEDVRVVELEPADEGWGDGFSPVVSDKLTEILETVWSLTKP